MGRGGSSQETRTVAEGESFMAYSRCESNGGSLTARRLEDFGTFETQAFYASVSM